MSEEKIKSFTAEYVNTLLEQYMIAYPESDREKIREIIVNECNESYSNPKVTFLNQETGLMNVIKYIRKNKPIMTGWGTFFCQHSQRRSIEYDLIQHFIDSRKVYKKKKFEHINDEDKTLFNMYDNYQQTFKIMNNSYYGITNEPNSFFYHPLIGASCTQTGFVIITTSINLFEKVMSANFLIRSLDDLTIYIRNILNEDYNIFDYIDKPIKKITLAKFLYERCTFKNEDTWNRIKKIVSKMSDEECNKVYFKNNFYEMIYHCKEFRIKLKKMLGNKIFLDPNEPPEELKPNLERLWDIFHTIVYYNYLDFYRIENAKYKKRKTVLTVDTDSNFLYVYPFYQCCSKLKKEMEDTEENRFITCNIVMYILTQAISACFDMLTYQFGIEDPEQRKIIQMKNEFYLSRLILTNNKKHYASKIYAQEGNILNKPKTELKGLAIKKVNTNRDIREYFTNMVTNDYLDPKEIDISKIYEDFYVLQDRLKKSFLNGEITFSIPGKVNAFKSYKFPIRQLTVRGTLLWNELYPNDGITVPDKVNYLKLNIPCEKGEYEYDKVCDIIDSDDTIDDKEKLRVKEVIKSVVYDNEEYAHFGLKIICFPKSIKQLPNWLSKMIAVEDMIEANLKPGYEILQSIRASVLSYQVDDNKGDKISNLLVI